MAIETINPSTGTKIKSYPEMQWTEIEQILNSAHRAFLDWRTTDFKQRAACMKTAGSILRENKESYARLMAEEMGKPLAQGRAEVEKCGSACDYYADHAKDFLASEEIATDASKSFVAFQPLGTVLAIMPWNFPFWQVFRFAAPAIMAGNAAVLKHAPNTFGCAVAVEEIFRNAGFPPGLFRSLYISIEPVPQIVAHPLIHAVTLTGSTRAGKAVASQAGAALKKTVLELGGSDPYVVLEDADLENAVETCVASRLLNTGQSCIAAKRFIVVDSVRRQFEEMFVEKMRSKTFGNPLEGNPDLGPLARMDLRDQLHRQVQTSHERGARVSTGGKLPGGRGAFYPPTVLTNVSKGMPAFDEETFGPAAAIIAARDEETALRIANDNPYGLGACVFTRDIQRGERIATERFEAGACFVNAFVKSDPRLPFGGIKESGYGRELSAFGIREFVNIKTVYVK